MTDTFTKWNKITRPRPPPRPRSSSSVLSSAMLVTGNGRNYFRHSCIPIVIRITAKMQSQSRSQGGREPYPRRENWVPSLPVLPLTPSACLPASFLTVAVPIFGAKNAPECTIFFGGVATPGPLQKERETPPRSHPSAPRSMLVLASSRLATAPCNQVLLVTHPSPPKIIQICRQLSELSLILPTYKHTKARPWSPWRR